MQMEKKYEDQAAPLREKMESFETKGKENPTLALPPRSEIHKNEPGQGLKWKVQFPVGKVLFLLFLVVVVAVGWYRSYPAKEVGTNVPKQETNKESIDGIETEKENPSSEVKEPTLPENGTAVELTDEKDAEAPPPVVEDSPESTVTQENEEPKKVEYEIINHRVEKGETLLKISRKYYGNDKGVGSILRWNGLKSDQIAKGQVIQVPIPIKK